MITRMRSKKQFPERMIALIAAIILLPMLVLPAGAAQKKETTRAIGIVFDNSGSMYVSGEQAWCRATYAIEVFAAMLNEKDILQVYPMSDIEVNGVTYTQTSPLTINGPGNAGMIREIFTPYAGSTPIEAITAARNGLQNVSADEKWLIVLTDGENFYRGGLDESNMLSKNDTQSALSELLGGYADEMNVMYLGIGNVQPPSVSGSAFQFYADKAPQSTDVLYKLTDMCNTIFGRDTLHSSADSISFDVTMNKIIVFVQGEEISDVVLKDSSGRKVGSQVSSYATKYSEKGTARYGDCTVDASLQGEIATYSDLDAGEYTLSYQGNMSSISVYYEPNVDLQTALLDRDGKEVDISKEQYAGTYQLAYRLVDKYGNPTSSALLGQTNYDMQYVLNGEEFTKTADSSGAVELELKADDLLSADITATYLSGYTVHKSREDLGWPKDGLRIVPRPAGTLETVLNSSTTEYSLSSLEDEGTYQILLYHDGKQLLGEELDATEVITEITGGNVEYETYRTDEGYALRLKYHSGSAEETDCGEYQLRIQSSYTNEDRQTVQGNEILQAFSVADDRRTLELGLTLSQSYYELTKLDESAPIVAHLTRNGQPLDAAEFEQTAFTVDSDGVTYDIQPKPEDSAYEIRIVNDEHAEKGVHTFSANATAVDEVGRELTASDSARYELQPYPKWVQIAMIAVPILLLLLLIWLFLNAKILPKKIRAPKCTFTVNGEPVPGSAQFQYSGKGKKNGSFSVQSPRYQANPTVKCGCQLSLEAASPRRIRPENREVLVKEVRALGSGVTSLQIGTKNFMKDDQTGKLVMAGGKSMTPFTIRSNALIKGTAVVQDVTGAGEDDVFFSTNVKFK